MVDLGRSAAVCLIAPTVVAQLRCRHCRLPREEILRAEVRMLAAVHIVFGCQRTVDSGVVEDSSFVVDRSSEVVRSAAVLHCLSLNATDLQAYVAYLDLLEVL